MTLAKTRMLKNQLSALVVALLALSACTATPDWSRAQAKEVRLRNGVPGEQVAVLSQLSKIEVVLQAFRRAERVSATGEERRRLWASSCFDVIGDRAVSGRWLYEADSGMFSKMDPLVHPVFRMTAEDKNRINALFSNKG